MAASPHFGAAQADAVPSRRAARMTSEAHRRRKPLAHRWRDVVDALCGYDFFISYSQTDGIGYPALLKAALEGPQRGRGFSVFVDTQDGFRAGDDLTVMTRRRVRSSSTHFVVVGRPRALLHSQWVPREAQRYAEAQAERASGRAPIIIDVDGALAAAQAQQNRGPGWTRRSRRLAADRGKPAAGSAGTQRAHRRIAGSELQWHAA